MSLEDGPRTEEEPSAGIQNLSEEAQPEGKKKLCPNCLCQMKIFGELSGWLVPEEYLCENCGYKGHVALELMPTDETHEEEK